MILSGRQEELFAILVQRYDEYGTEDGSFFDTYNGGTKRTLRALEKAGHVTCWVDPQDPACLWAAPAAPNYPED